MKMCVKLRVNYIEMNYGKKCYLIHKKKEKRKNFEGARKKKVVLDKFLKPYFKICISKNFQNGEP